MEVLTIEKCFLKKQKEEKQISIKFAREGIAIKPTEGQVMTVEASRIKNLELFRGVRAISLRIFSDDVFYLNGINENHIDDLKKICGEWYKINIYMKELEINNTNSGELVVNNNAFVEFRNEKTVFDIPIANVDSLADIRNEISLRFDNCEIRFITDRDTITEIKDVCNRNIEEDLFTLDEVTVLNPRGKNNLKFYKDYFRIIGYSYDHKIYYKGILNLFLLNKTYLENEEKYLVLELENPIRQGQTKYPLVVLCFGEEEVDFEVNDERLDKNYSGLLSEVLCRILESLCVIKRKTSSFTTTDKLNCLKCILKAYEGQLYPLDTSLLFLPKGIKIEMKEIQSVEFSRINISLMQAKTFDMTIFGDSQYIFYGLNKEDFGSLEKYFTEKNIKIRSEVIDEVISSDESEGEDSGEFVVSDESN